LISILLPVYEAIEFLAKTEGGTTHPWVVSVNESDKRYVAKLFTNRQMEQSHSVAKEVFGNFLAREFDLPVPDAALIRFGEQFCQTLDQERQEELAAKHRGLKFGCAWHEGMELLAPDYFENPRGDDYEVGSIFAFDSLVRNIDRGGPRKKPNLLFRDTDFLLIDHELILPFADSLGSDRILSEIGSDTHKWSYKYEDHLFYNLLKNKKSKKSIFDTFIDYLERLNPDKLDPIAKQLEAKDLSVGNFELLKRYLCEMKANAGWFHCLLNTIIQ
jgi:hypothetical protein